MSLSQSDGQRILQVLHKETGGKLVSRKKIVEYIKNYIALIPKDIMEKYTVKELYDFLTDCWDYGTFKKW